MPRIGQDQHPTLGFFNGRQLTGFEQQGFDVLVRPHRGLCLSGRYFGRQNRTQTGPQRHKVVLFEFVAVVLRQIFESSEIVHASVVLWF